VAALAVLIGALALTNQSLWIDEGSAALKAMEPSLGGWWQALRSEGNSNLQLIGELFYLWGWEKIFGNTEIALRASNIPFFVGGVLALAWGLAPRRRLQTAVVLLVLTNAFLWYYLSEARPYLALFCFASLTAACLFRSVRASEECLESTFWFHLFCIGIIGLCATSLIAVPWALGALGAILYGNGLNRTMRSALRCKTSSILFIVTLGALGLYYLWTLQVGARASDVGRTGWANVGFIFYELTGLSGLGPGRLALRTNGIGELMRFVPRLALGAIALLVLIVSALIELRGQAKRRHLIFFLFAVVIPFLVVIAAGVFAHMRLVGRHLTPLLPFLLAVMAFGLARLLEKPTIWTRATAFGTLAVVLVSALEIRFGPHFRRDDYRSAAAVARTALDAGEKVWWLADVSTGRYYHVPFGSPQLTVTPDLSGPVTTPDLVIFSKPDIYDASDAVRHYLTANGFTVTQILPAFEILKRSPVR